MMIRLQIVKSDKASFLVIAVGQSVGSYKQAKLERSYRYNNIKRETIQSRWASTYWWNIMNFSFFLSKTS